MPSSPKALGKKLIAAGLGLGLWSAQARPGWAWDFAGHFVIGALAYQQLSVPARTEAERLIRLLAQAEPAIQDFVPATAWLDAQNWSGDFSLMRDWHYAGWSFPPGACPDSGRLGELSLSALQTLTGQHGSDFQKALMLRVLLHTIGDMHQPLHTINVCRRGQPEGDRGGGTFPLLGAYANLHALWDAAGGQFPYLQLNQWQAALPLAEQLAAEYPPAALPLVSNQETLSGYLAHPEAWIGESNRLAQAEAYQGVSPGTAPSPAYLARVRRLTRRQLALAGYRLAHLLNAALTPGS